jgi:hypothetical protein
MGRSPECLTLPQELAATKGGGAFLVRMRMQDIVLLMEDGRQRTWFFRMHRPYSQGVRGS